MPSAPSEFVSVYRFTTQAVDDVKQVSVLLFVNLKKGLWYTIKVKLLIEAMWQWKHLLHNKYS